MMRRSLQRPRQPCREQRPQGRPWQQYKGQRGPPGDGAPHRGGQGHRQHAHGKHRSRSPSRPRAGDGPSWRHGGGPVQPHELPPPPPKPPKVRGRTRGGTQSRRRAWLVRSRWPACAPLPTGCAPSCSLRLCHVACHAASLCCSARTSCPATQSVSILPVIRTLKRPCAAGLGTCQLAGAAAAQPCGRASAAWHA